MQGSRPTGANLEVAPLFFGQSRSNSYTDESTLEGNVCQRTEMTPPTTPNDSQEDLSEEAQSPAIFHNFLRAFYPFHPGYALTDSSVTLPLDEGDIVLVHSIHTNGWADGTLLSSGARGWLPTNYCEAYEPEDLRNLLNALLNFWDLLRSTSINDYEIFGNQEFMKGIIAGVRFLLQRTNCLNRESPIVQRSEPIRKCRKLLMSELSSLVKTAKRLQECQRALSPAEDANDIIDEMILKAFRIVMKGVRFSDTLEADRKARAPASVTVMDTVAEEAYNPPTPPAERMSLDGGADVKTPTATDAGSESAENAESFPLPLNKRLSSLVPPPDSPHAKRSSSLSHRVSVIGPSTSSRPHHLASERLNRGHDSFLSHLGSFIGRLHLQSQSQPELVAAIKLCAVTGGQLLAVIDGVRSHTTHLSDILTMARDAVFESIQDLVSAARNTLSHTGTEEADMIMPHDNSLLLVSATSCVRAAGDCIAKAKTAIERVGDFEFEPEEIDLGINLDALEAVVREREPQPAAGVPSSDTASVTESTRTSSSVASRKRHVPVSSLDKPLPDVPQTDPEDDVRASPVSSAPPSRPESLDSKANNKPSTRPPFSLPKLSTSYLPDSSTADHSGSEHEYQLSSRFDSIVASSAGSSATYLSRDSEASIVSQSSTRATTPDHTLQPRNKPSMSELSTTGSSSHTEDDDVESRLHEKTFAHELIFNKEGQVTGGSLPALVERLTTHEAAPDALFVSTFYLTFRLFSTPVKFAEALIDRFDYVADSPRMAAPVRLRVYNALKGWLESHWRHNSDRDALRLIIPFAETKLRSVLPSAGRRIMELAHRVSGDRALVPRLVSSMSKANTLAQLVPAELPIPQPIISKSQQNLLNSFKSGLSVPTILDFEPVEIARQLTIKQMNIFCSILPEELLASQWMKKGGVDAPSVKAMSSLSTDLSNLVADTILQYSEIKKRALVVKQWIKIAHQCLELHNYDGLMAIICSLNSSTISRLRKTWDLISPKRKELLRTLQLLVEPSQNNKVLRTRLHDHVPPCLPFLGMYLTDLTFVDIGNPATKHMSLGSQMETKRESGLTVVNFDKHMRTAKIVGELQRFQIPYRLGEVREMQDWLSVQINRVREGDQGNVQVIYYRKSLFLEPREATPRTPLEAPTTPILGSTSRGAADLFGWMSRDRGATTPAPV